eukprot:PhF_6_TR10840/c1_g1_i7/m.17524
MDISQINTLYENSLTTEDGYHIGIRMNPPEYDLEFSCSHEQRTEFVRCVQAVWRYVTGRTHHGQIIPMVTKSFAHEVVKECVLKKPAGWTLNITAPTSQKTFRLKLQKFNQQQQQQQLNAASITSPPTSPPLQDPTTASFSSATTKTIELDPSSPTQKPQQPQQVQSPSSPASPDSSPRGRTGPPTFVRGTQIAKGGFGVVYQAINLITQEHVAVKEIPIAAGSSSSSSLQAIKKEFDYLWKLRHPNVVSVYHFEIKGPNAYIYMELMPMGSVSNIIRSFKRLHENTARKYITHALAALAYLHEHNVIHRDIKPANMLVSHDGTVKLTDFGTCRCVSTNTTEGIVGTVPYMSPATVKGETSMASDLWALGCSLVEMTSGTTPWSETNYVDQIPLLHHIGTRKSNEFPRIACHLSPKAVEFIQLLFEGKWSAKDLCSHAFVNNLDEDLVGCEPFEDYLEWKDSQTSGAYDPLATFGIFTVNLISQNSASNNTNGDSTRNAGTDQEQPVPTEGPPNHLPANETEPSQVEVQPVPTEGPPNHLPANETEPSQVEVQPVPIEGPPSSPPPTRHIDNNSQGELPPSSECTTLSLMEQLKCDVTKRNDLDVTTFSSPDETPMSSAMRVDPPASQKLLDHHPIPFYDEMFRDGSPPVLPPLTIKCLQIIGNGTSGTVYQGRVYFQTHHGAFMEAEVAVKKLPVEGCLTTHPDKAKILLEFYLALNLCHPNVLGALSYQIIRCATNGPYYFGYLCFKRMRTDFEKEVNNRRSLSMEEIKTHVRHILLGLAYIHGLGYVHCDIKPANLFIDYDGNALIGDFGSMTKVHCVASGGFTTNYMSQKLLRNSSAPVSFSDDLWALGMTVLYMSLGRLPDGVEGKVGSGQNVIPDGIDLGIKSFVECLFSADSAEEVLQHEFVN